MIIKGSIRYCMSNREAGWFDLGARPQRAGGVIQDSSGNRTPVVRSTWHSLYAAIAGDKLYFMKTTLIFVSVALGLAAQTHPNISAVSNAADYSSAVAPGSLATIFGADLANKEEGAASTPLPRILSGAAVFVNDIQAPLLFVSGKQINFQIPFGVSLGAANVVVVNADQRSSPMTISVAAAAPSIFLATGHHGAIQNQDSTANTSDNPALAGSVIVVYLTGIGAISPLVAEGVPTPTAPLSKSIARSSATIGGIDAPMQFLGLAPGFVGLAQANIQVPASLAAGDLPMTITVDDTTSISALVSIRAASAFDPIDKDGLLPPNNQALTAADVIKVITNAAMAVNNSSMVIAVTDRQGNPLAVFRKTNAPDMAEGNFGQQVPTSELAVALARTASFFSNTQAPLSSRTVRFISGAHFPPGIMFTSQAALYGIENTNRGCGAADANGVFHEFAATFVPGKEVPAARSIDRSSNGLGILTGKKNVNDSVPYPLLGGPGAVNPGGIPIYKGGRLVGGVGVAGIANVPNDNFNGTVAEYAALAGAAKSGLFQLPPDPGVVVIDGIALPFVDDSVLSSILGGKQLPGTTAVAAGTSLDALGTFLPLPVPLDSKAISGAPYDSPGPVPEGYLVPVKAGPLGGLTADEVQQIFTQSIATGEITRALIRLPLGVRAKFVIAVSDLDGQLLGLYRMKDATIFSIDVAVSKSRNVVYFSGQNRLPQELPGVPVGTAVTNRTIEFGAEPFYPPGIDYSGPGPWFDLYKFDVANPCTQGAQPKNPYQSGIVFFPGSVPLYKNGVMVGGLGISGDGVDQDDFATVGGAAGFMAPEGIRADRIIDLGVRLPYTKFPRNPVD
jgi:uncharacterized protein (TIGR03437 family)